MPWSALLVAAGESAPGAHRLLSSSVRGAVWLLEAPFPPGHLSRWPHSGCTGGSHLVPRLGLEQPMSERRSPLPARTEVGGEWGGVCTAAGEHLRRCHFRGAGAEASLLRCPCGRCPPSSVMATEGVLTGGFLTGGFHTGNR